MKKALLGNSRLLGLVQDPQNLDLNRALAAVEAFVASSPRVELANEKICLAPEGDALLAGREIAGHPGALGDDLVMKDCKAARAMKLRFDEDAQTAAHAVELAREEARRRGMRLLRLEFDLDNFTRPFIFLSD